MLVNGLMDFPLKGRNELISLILGILYALGPAGELKQKLVGDTLKELRQRTNLNQELELDLRRLAQEAVASVCSYNESSDYREGWEYLSSVVQSSRSSEEWRVKIGEERRDIPRAVFSPTGIGEIFLGSHGDLAVIEVFGIKSEFIHDGQIRESRGTVLAGFIDTNGKWLIQSISWYPESEN